MRSRRCGASCTTASTPSRTRSPRSGNKRSRRSAAALHRRIDMLRGELRIGNRRAGLVPREGGSAGAPVARTCTPADHERRLQKYVALREWHIRGTANRGQIRFRHPRNGDARPGQPGLRSDGDLYNQGVSLMKKTIALLSFVLTLALASAAGAALVPGIYDPGTTGCPVATLSGGVLHLEKNCPTPTKRLPAQTSPASAGRRSHRRHSRSPAPPSATAARRGSTSSPATGRSSSAATT